MQFIKLKKASVIFAAISGVFVVLVAVCTFFDLDISKAISIIGAGKYYPESFLGRFFETFGVIPVYAVTAFALSIVFHYVLREKSCPTVVKCICGVIIAGICVALGRKMYNQTFKYAAIHFGFDDELGGITDEIAYWLAGALSTGALLFFMKDVSDEFLNKTLVWAIVVLFAAAISQAFVQGLKNLAGRARFATLNVQGDFSDYSRWYEFKGKRAPSNELLTLGAGGDAYRSFPSGHSAASGVSLAIAFLPACFGIKKEKVSFWLLTVLPIAFTLGTMLSRIIEGAHFCTDVLFGAYFVVLGIYIGISVTARAFKNFKPLKNEKRKQIVEEREF